MCQAVSLSCPFRHTSLKPGPRSGRYPWTGPRQRYSSSAERPDNCSCPPIRHPLVSEQNSRLLPFTEATREHLLRGPGALFHTNGVVDALLRLPALRQLLMMVGKFRLSRIAARDARQKKLQNGSE